MKPESLELIPNWAPTADLMLSKVPRSVEEHERTRCGIFTTSGRSPYGGISELRHGLDARLGVVFESEEFSSVTGMWPLPIRTVNGLFFILSFPLRSALLHLSGNASDMEPNYDEANCGIHFASETLLASVIPGDKIVQICRRSIAIVSPRKVGSEDDRMTLQRECFESMPLNVTISAAAVEADSGVILTAFRDDVENSYQLAQLIADIDGARVIKVGNAADLAQEGTCVWLSRMEGELVAFVGTMNGKVQIFQIDEKQGLIPLIDHIIFSQEFQTSETPRPLAGSPIPCESVVILRAPQTKDPTRTEYIMVCGLRNGNLYTVELNLHLREPADNPKSTAEPERPTVETEGRTARIVLSFGRKKTLAMGYTSVKVIEDASNPGLSAFVLCGSEICQLRCADWRYMGLHINSVWFTDRKQPWLQQAPISTLARIPKLDHIEKGLADALVCIYQSTFLVAQLEEKASTVPRTLSIHGTPTKVFYSEGYKMIVTAGLRTEICHPKPPSGHVVRPGKRVTRGIIQFMGRNTQPNEDYATVELLPSERVYALTEWLYQGVDGSRYCSVVAGTGFTGSKDRHLTGRVLFLQFLVDNPKGCKVKVNKVWEVQEGPVYAIAPYGATHLVFTAGNMLRMETFHTIKRK